MASAPAKFYPNGAGHPATDSRTSQLYSDEHRSLRPAEAWRLLVRSWQFIREHRRLVWMKAALSIVSLTFFLMTPWPVKIIIDNVIDRHPLTGLARTLIVPLAGDDPAKILLVVISFLAIAAIVVGMVGDRSVELGADVQSWGLDQAGFTQNDANDGWSLWNGLFGYLETRLTLDLTQRITHSVRTRVYRAFMDSPLALYTDQKIGDAVFRVMHDSAAVSAVFYRGVLGPVLSIVMFVMALIVLWAQFPNEPVVPAVAALMLPIFAIFATLFGRLLRDQSQQMRESSSGAMAAFEERLSHVHLIKAFGREQHESRAIDEASWTSFRSTLKLIVIGLALFLVVMPLVGLLMETALYHVMKEIIAGNMTLGDTALLAGYGMMLGRPMAILGGTWAAMQLPAAGLRRIYSVMDRLDESASPVALKELTLPISSIELRDVSVGYAVGSPVLTSVSMQMRRGEMIALAGPSGTGKTTLILALPRFMEPQSGKIVIDGTDSRLIAPASLRNKIGFVFQQEALFADTIEENIRYGRPEATADAIRRAAEMAGAAEFIASLPDGYSTILGRRGARLSVGQKQRIAIARALLTEPDLLILDEPTAPLDQNSETNLIATLRAIARKRIVLIVAHRASTLSACDRVYFMSDGLLRATGSHPHLAASSPAYRAYLATTESEIRA